MCKIKYECVNENKLLDEEWLSAGGGRIGSEISIVLELLVRQALAYIYTDIWVTLKTRYNIKSEQNTEESI